jgi:hypothetical protein
MKDLKHLKTFEQYSSEVEETNEGIFGISKEQTDIINNLAAKGKLEDADIETLVQNKLVGAIMNSFKLSNPGTQAGDIAIKEKNRIIANPKSAADVVYNFVKVYADALKNTKASKFYSIANNKLYAKLGATSSPTGLISAVGSY